MSLWRVTHFQDVDGARLADGHYTRRTVGAKQFMPPGERFALITPCKLAVFGWWRPHPTSGIVAMNGFDGWTCSIFRNTGAGLSSELILDAERELVAYANERWQGTAYAPCGPSGLLTYVQPKKIRSSNAGYCFKQAGWRKHPTKPKSSKGFPLFWKPFDLAGIQATGVAANVTEVRHAA